MDALLRVKVGSTQYEKGSKERKALEQVLAFYGGIGEKNGVVVSFGRYKGMHGAESRRSDGKVEVRFDLALIENDTLAWRKTDPRVDLRVELAGTVAHEGTHGFDDLTTMLTIGREASESNAFNAQSLVNRGFNTPSPYGIWNPSWNQVDQRTQDQRRLRAVDQNAKRAARIGEALK